jgi:hypothetical protein
MGLGIAYLWSAHSLVMRHWLSVGLNGIALLKPWPAAHLDSRRATMRYILTIVLLAAALAGSYAGWSLLGGWCLGSSMQQQCQALLLECPH